MVRGIAARLHLCSRDELRVVDELLCAIERHREARGELDLAHPPEPRPDDPLLDRAVGLAGLCASVHARDLVFADIEAERVAREGR